MLTSAAEGALSVELSFRWDIQWDSHHSDTFLDAVMRKDVSGHFMGNQSLSGLTDKDSKYTIKIF